MANTYTQIHIQLIFAVRFRQALISSQWRDDLHQYMTGIIQNNDHKLLQINSVSDHIHILMGLRPVQSLSGFVQNLKTESAKWINSKRLCNSRFAWQDGYAAFSYSRSQLPKVIRYIQNQQAHHKKQDFLEEYRRFLDAFEIEYDERYLFRSPQ